jgi:hypothetical protein
MEKAAPKAKTPAKMPSPAPKAKTPAKMPVAAAAASPKKLSEAEINRLMEDLRPNIVYGDPEYSTSSRFVDSIKYAQANN